MRSRAAIFTSPDQPLTIDEVEYSEPAPGDVLIRLYATGICHSDLHYFRGYRGAGPPRLLGHEGSGEVVAVGEGVEHLKPGDHVVTSLIRRTGPLSDTDHPTSRSSIRWNDAELDGHAGNVYTWAEHSMIDADYAVKVPDDTPREVTAPLGCGVMTGAGTVLNAIDAKPGRTAAVWGVGGVGLSAVAALKVRGASRIIAVDLDDAKLEFSRKFGVTDTVNASSGDPVEAVRELTGGGVDYAIDAIGAKGTTEQIVRAARGRRGTERGGVAAMIATGNMVRVPTGEMVIHDKTLIGARIGSCVPERDYPEILRWHREGLFDLEALVTERHTLDDVNVAVQRLLNGQVFGRSVVVF